MAGIGTGHFQEYLLKCGILVLDDGVEGEERIAGKDLFGISKL